MSEVTFRIANGSQFEHACVKLRTGLAPCGREPHLSGRHVWGTDSS